MANVIKHKRGSGSDPSASNLVVGELAIRTDTGKLFTKMDSGSIAEIAGGGSDIAINTLSSSSATGGGSATFNGSAYRFTLSSPPSVSAQQLLVSINGVIQKPVAGTGQPSEGFSVDGNDIILGDAPATGSDFFILTFRSLGVSEPADNSVTSAKIVDGAIVNADINASAAIAGTKISPDFGSQNIVTTGTTNLSGELRANGNINMTNASPKITFTDDNDNPDFEIGNLNGIFRIRDATNSANRLVVNTDGHVDVIGNLDVGAGIDVTGVTTTTGRVNIGDTQMSSNLLNVEDGTAAAIDIASHGSGGDTAYIGVKKSTGGGLTFGISNRDIIFKTGATYSNGTTFDSGTERLRIFSDGDTQINTANDKGLFVKTDGNNAAIRLRATGGTDNGGFRLNHNAPNSLLLFDRISSNGVFASTLMTLESSGNLTFNKSVYGEQDSEDFYRIKFNDVGGTGNDVGIGQPDSSSIGFNTVSNGSIRFYQGTDGEVMRIHTNTFLGVGTASPIRQLHVKATNSSVARFESTHATIAQISFASLDSATDVFIGATADTNFFVNTGNTQRLVIDNSGVTQMAVGSSVLFSRNTGGTNTTAVQFKTAGSQVGKIFFNNTETIYSSGSSDRTLKKNFENWTETILTSFKNLNPQKFNFLQEENTDTKHKGFIAQDLADKFPEAYPIDPETDKYGFNPSGMVVYLMKAVQELTAKVEALEAK